MAGNRTGALVVQKYGGTSVGDAERIKRVARRIAETAGRGNSVVVVVSAMGDTTDELIALAKQVARDPVDREMDHLLATGEQVSASLTAMALIDRGCPAVSLTAVQAGIRTTGLFSRARIADIHPERIRRELDEGRVPIVTGFQGITEDYDVTTLGRGGSDTSAVALAAALAADRCEIYTDVEGIYTADPRVVPAARKLDEISYEEMLELAQLGARVMHPRAVELGEVYDVPILVRSSFSDAPGTLIHRIENVEVRKHVRGIAHDTDVAKIRIHNVPDRPGIAAAIFTPLADAGISVDTIVQNTSLDGKTDISFTVTRADQIRAVEMVKQVVPQIGAEHVDHSGELAKVSIVGTGMQSAPGYAARMFQTLAGAGINIDMITTSDIRITCIIAVDQVEPAMNALHATFELD
ncbi:MAG: aspartate kinase [Chloroflexota bacterium]|nr:aspartate kinase [Chloroflexota bacterium]